MADPRQPCRLIDDASLSEEARAILRSAESDIPSEQSRARVARALGLAAGAAASGEAAAATGAGAAATASSGWWMAGAVVLGLGLAGVAAIGGYQAFEDSPAETRTGRAAPRADIETAAPEAAPPEAMPKAAPETAPLGPPAPEVAPRPARRAVSDARRETARREPRRIDSRRQEARPDRAQPDAARSETKARPAAVDAGRLAAEVALLDRARAELARGDTAAAARSLARHGREFAGGALVAEAQFLELRILLRRGQRAAATALARRFLERFPLSPLARRVRALVGPDSR
jgi:type IV secretory pathway VirB10-like protein